MPFVEHQGVRTFFDVRGDGPPVVLGHSFLCSGEMWARQLDPLAQRFRLINIDLRGHGQSANVRAPFTLYDLVDDILLVLDHLGIERATWAGLSIGGMVAMRGALVARDRVSGLILIDTDAGAERAYKKLKYRMMGLGTRLLGFKPFLPAVVPLMFGRTTRKENPALVEDWKTKAAEVHIPSILFGLDALVRRDSIVGRLSEIDMPSLVIVGDEDQSLPPWHSSQIAAGINGSSLVTIPKSGHLAALEQPELVTSAMLEFLTSLETPPE